MYSNEDIQRVKERADIRNFIPGADHSKMNSYVRCPNCGKEGKGKGLCVTHNKSRGIDLAKCFSCDFKLTGAIDADMYYSKRSFAESVKHVAQDSGILIETEEERKKRIYAEKMREVRNSFCLRQLEASGLTLDDVMVVVNTDNGQELQPSFRRGGMDNQGNINGGPDEMLIYYYDIYGHPVTYTKKNSRGKLWPYVRVRWSNPSLHLGKDGREIKYMSPAGAPARLYIPQHIRDLFSNGEKIETLIIQEGEKKAEKACKHGIHSVGIQGIYNIGNEENGLIQDLQQISKECQVKNMVLLFDADWNNLSKNLSFGDRVDVRPKQFAKAAIKFKKYIETLHNVGIHVDIYFGHINPNPKDDKGIDDLLTNTLKGNEDTLSADIVAAIHSHNGKGEYVSIHKISTLSDIQIKDFWHLNNSEKFFNLHKERLLPLQSFKFDKYLYTVEGDKILSSTNTGEKEFWAVIEKDDGQKKVEIKIWELLKFLHNNGFARILPIGGNSEIFVRVQNNIIVLVRESVIRDFVFEYVITTANSDIVIEQFASNLEKCLGSGKLERLEKIDDPTPLPEPHIQTFHYLNGQVDVTSESVRFDKARTRVTWDTDIIQRDFSRTQIISNMYKDEDGHVKVEFTEKAQQCEFLRFLINMSRPDLERRIGLEMDSLTMDHVVNKITVTGSQLVDYKYQSEQRATVFIDGVVGDVGQNNGRTGKSIWTKSISKIKNQVVIDGRALNSNDQFLFGNVTSRTRSLCFDDLKQNFNFESIYPAVTGDLTVNPKGGARYTIPYERSPKILITTNHAIKKGYDTSSVDRLVYMVAFPYYSPEYSPFAEFGHTLFDGWDEEQWNLFDNLMADCAMFYLKSLENNWGGKGRGAISPPEEMVKLRTLKQEMGEAFFQWAERYFDPSGTHLNTRVSRQEMFYDCSSTVNSRREEITSNDFSDKLKAYCKFHGYHLNSRKKDKRGRSYQEFRHMFPKESFIGGFDKTSGSEYYTISTTEHADSIAF